MEFNFVVFILSAAIGIAFIRYFINVRCGYGERKQQAQNQYE